MYKFKLVFRLQNLIQINHWSLLYYRSPLLPFPGSSLAILWKAFCHLLEVLHLQQSDNPDVLDNFATQFLYQQASSIQLSRICYCNGACRKTTLKTIRLQYITMESRHKREQSSFLFRKKKRATLCRWLASWNILLKQDFS